jgi:hypothetical protein
MLIPNSISNETYKSSNGSGIRSIFAANPIIELEYDSVEEEVKPYGEGIEIPLKTTFHLVGSFAKLQSRLLKYRVFEIRLSIVDQPDWCQANIKNDIVELPLDHTEPYLSTLEVTVSENAPALIQGIVKIKAEFPEISGLFFTRVNEDEATFEILFIVGYHPAIRINLLEPNDYPYMEISPLNITNIKIGIRNLGNGPTYVEFEIQDKPENWSINFPSSVLLGSAINGRESSEKQLVIKVLPPKYFSYESIKISIKHHYLGIPDLKGRTEGIHLFFSNDGSLKEEEPDIFLQIILVFAIGLIIPTLIFLIKRRKGR